MDLHEEALPGKKALIAIGGQSVKKYDEIPSGVPVILHCGAGVVSVPAYETLMEKRKDIPQLSYIAGHPPVDEFNKWLEDHEK